MDLHYYHLFVNKIYDRMQMTIALMVINNTLDALTSSFNRCNTLSISFITRTAWTLTIGGYLWAQSNAIFDYHCKALHVLIGLGLFYGRNKYLLPFHSRPTFYSFPVHWKCAPPCGNIELCQDGPHTFS